MKEKIFFIISMIEACDDETQAIAFSLVSYILEHANTPKESKRVIDLMYERLQAA